MATIVSDERKHSSSFAEALDRFPPPTSEISARIDREKSNRSVGDVGARHLRPLQLQLEWILRVYNYEPARSGWSYGRAYRVSFSCSAAQFLPRPSPSYPPLHLPISSAWLPGIHNILFDIRGCRFRSDAGSNRHFVA